MGHARLRLKKAGCHGAVRKQQRSRGGQGVVGVVRGVCGERSPNGGG